MSGVPETIATAWGLRDRPRKGPKPALSMDRIIAAAVRVADSEGLDAVSMARVAAAAGTAPMSLYRHVPGKDQLLELMVDAVWGEPPVAPAAGDDWRAGMSRWAWTMRTRAQQHPWAVRVPLSSLPVLPNQVAWFENGLSCLRGTGLSEPRKASVIMLISGYVRNIASTEADIFAAMGASGLSPSQWMASYAQMLRTLAEPDRFPALAAFIDAGVFDVADGPDDEFSFGLDRILDGIGALIDREAARPLSQRGPVREWPAPGSHCRLSRGAEDQPRPL